MITPSFMGRWACILTFSASALLSAQEKEFLAEAFLVAKGGDSVPVFVMSADRKSVRYKETAQTTAIRTVALKDTSSVFMVEPDVLLKAKDLYRGRKYREALPLFKEVKDRYQPVVALPENPASIAAFFEMECHRHLGDYAALAGAMEEFNKEGLTRGDQRRQLELNLFWEMSRGENWEQLESLTRERMEEALPPSQRVQVSYLNGLALEKLNRPDDALTAYEVALVADLGASDDVARLAALAILGIHHANPLVQEAMASDGVGAPASQGRLRLGEAAAVAQMFQTYFSAGQALPEEFHAFLKFLPSDPTAES